VLVNCVICREKPVLSVSARLKVAVVRVRFAVAPPPADIVSAKLLVSCVPTKAESLTAMEALIVPAVRTEPALMRSCPPTISRMLVPAPVIVAVLLPEPPVTTAVVRLTGDAVLVLLARDPLVAPRVNVTAA
jgi:hypothetical protein